MEVGFSSQYSAQKYFTNNGVIQQGICNYNFYTNAASRKYSFTAFTAMTA
jgi:hypothetical protein